MLKNKTIFILSLMKFDGLASTNFAIAKNLAMHNEVYYIEHPFTYKDLRYIDKQSPQYLIRAPYFGAKNNGLLPKKIEGVHVVISQPIWPINFLPMGKVHDFFTKLNENIVLKRVLKIIRDQNIQEYLFMNIYDFRFPFFGRSLSATLNIYYCVDPIVGPYDIKHGVRAEDILVKQADVVICTSRALYEEKKLVNERTYFVPNGADIVGSLEDSKKMIIPEFLKEMPGPIVGYIGAIERRIDFDLIKYLADQFPSLHFIFVGPLYKEHVPDWFFNISNIHIFQPVPYEQVPAVINAFDVCIIPFKKDDLSRTIFPLKLFEYLGLGKPVIVTDFNEDLQEFSLDAAVFHGDYEQFGIAIMDGLKKNTKEEALKRMEVAKENTWSNRVARISEIIEQHLSRPK